jgi:succinate dehydrogenase / fumarate reductase iron-sulfur subunit
MEERVVDRRFDPLVWLGAKLGIRNRDDDGREEVWATEHPGN